MDILKDFGVQPVLLAAQVVNFFVLLFILKKLLYKPILKVLEERKQKISLSIKNAEEIELKLQKTEEDRVKRLVKATQEAQKVIDDATKSASGIIAQAHTKASSDIENLLLKAHQQIELDREKMQNQLREELADLVVLSLQKVTGKILKDKDQKDLIDKSIKNI